VPLSPGQQLGHFEIVAPLGAGGMGEVYRARDTRLGREVALKILPREFVNDRDRRTRFEHEARAVAALNHPGIVALFDIGNDGDTHYIVNELVEGATLRATLTGGAMPQRKAIEVAADIADALGAAHAKGITHRDLKPENIMITRDGRAKILDFGLAKDRSPRADGATETAVTDPGVVMGTVGYMSPEQVEAQQADHRSDVFSFGAVLYEMISGTRAFAKSTQVETLTAILREDPVPLAVSAALQQITARCLEKEPERRFQSMRDLAFALRTSSTATTTTHAAIVTKAKRNWLWPATALACLALVFVPRGEVTGNKLKLTPIARDKMTESNPEFSPDGKSLAYLRTDHTKTQIMLRVLADSEPVVLTEYEGRRSGAVTSSPSWSQDGVPIFYPGRDGLYRIAVSGGAPRQILPRPGVAAAIPGSSGLAIASAAGAYSVQLDVIDAIDAKPRPIAKYETPFAAGLGLYVLKFAPGGRRLALTASGGLLIIDWPSGALLKTYTSEPTIRSFGWMPDGGHGVMAGMFRAGIEAIDIDSGATRMLHPGSISHASASPDGRRIALVPTTVTSDIVEFSITGERVRDLVSSVEMAQAPEWSPDGKRLAFRQYLTPDTSAVMVRDLAAGTNHTVVRLPIRGTIPSPQFSPDGKRIVYPDDGKLWTVLASGGIATQLIEAERGSVTCWSPDGSWILTSSGNALRKIPAGGGPAVNLNANTKMRIGSCTWAKSGIYISSRSGILRIPENGGAAVSIGEFVGASVNGISPDGTTLYLSRSGNQLLAVDAKTGQVTKTVDIQADGLVRGVSVHPDGKRLAVWIERTLSDLWLLEGFPVPTTGIERLFRKWKDPS